MFTTPVNIKESEKKISIEQPCLALGSCFAQSIGNKLLQNKFNVLINPFGTIFNPVSLNSLIKLVFKQDELDKTKVVERDGLFFHYDFHSDFFAPSEAELINKIENALQKVALQIQSASWIFLTLGTAYVHEWQNKIVANCHKQSQHLFEKRLLSTTEIVNALKEINKMVLSQNDNIQFIGTLSPVRHSRETFPLNNLSKAKLLIPLHEMDQNDNWQYFPAYELLLDELRDYRFYANDMLHPSELAEDFIWKKFQQTYFDQETQHFVTEWSTIQKALNHNAFHPTSAQHQKFLNDMVKKLEELSKHVNVDQELYHIKHQML